MDYLSNLPIDLFINQITYLPFSEVIKVCGPGGNKKLNNYCSDPNYNSKYLISNGADIHAQNNNALRWASRNGHLEIVNHLESLH